MMRLKRLANRMIITLIISFIFIQCNSVMPKDKIIFHLYEKDSSNYKDGKDYMVGTLFFEPDKEKETRTLELGEIKSDIWDFDKFKDSILLEDFPSYIDKYNFYLFIEKKEGVGSLIPVKKVYKIRLKEFEE